MKSIPGIHLSLHRIESLLQKIGNPHKKIPPIFHVGGTNGKGSTIAFLRSILEAAHYKVHTYTSPHLVSPSERIIAAGQPIDPNTLEQLMKSLNEITDDITYFELLTCAAFLYFSSIPADFTLLEVGLGGRLDATNVISDPLASILSSISLDHETFLGHSLEVIAQEKACIQKSHCLSIIGPQSPEVRKVLKDYAQKVEAPLLVYGEDWNITLENNTFSLLYNHSSASSLFNIAYPSLRGQHQIFNAAQAITALQHTVKHLTTDQISQGVTHAFWPARLQKIDQGYIFNILPSEWSIFVDGTHNPGGAKTLKDFIDHRQKKFFLIYGTLNTKDYKQSLEIITNTPLFEEIIILPIFDHDGATPQSIAQECPHHKSKICSSFEEALQYLKSQKPIDLYITGSLYLAGQFLQWNKTPPLAEYPAEDTQHSYNKP